MADEGWIESVDPTSGRTFYANRYTRTTQWDPPPGWKSTTAARHGGRGGGDGGSSNGGYGTSDNLLSDIARARGRMEEMKVGVGYNQQSQSQRAVDPDALPDGWEEMTDPSTGRKFYIDHATKTTTWERPTSRSVGGSARCLTGEASGFDFSGNHSGVNDNGMPSMMKLNQYGSHSRWDDDVHTGSRASHSHQHHSNNHHHHESDYNEYHGGLSGASSSHAGPPPLDFVVVSVPDAMRMKCPGCSSTFTYTKRRHHCRLCGDVFCDACSSSRTVLPLDGPEYASPVRVCDWCMKDVKKGNYFSLRRYLTPLQLFDPSHQRKLSSVIQDGAGSGDKTKEITADTVAASLSSLSADIDAMVNEPMTFKEKMTLPASVLVPAVGKHLKERTTAEYAIRVLASLLMLGNVVGDDSFALAIYEGEGGMQNSESTNSVPSLSSSDGSRGKLQKQQAGEIVDDVLTVLEWNGTDDRSLSALEQAAKVIYYIAEPNFIAEAISKRDSRGINSESKDDGSDGPVDVDEVAESLHDFIKIDIHRAFRSMLDHATSSASPSLQRWATASLRHLITEDRRRACVYSSGPKRYESFTTQLVSTGGIMILCSLLSSDDAETRTHATSTLEAIVVSTREIGLALGGTSSGGFSARVGRGTKDDSRIVDAIVSNGGCGPALAHLLISADESVAMMGCSFASSLISPLLTDPRGSGQSLQQCVSAGALDSRDDGLSSYRDAALALVVGEGNGSQGEVSCLPSLIQILRSGTETSWGGKSRSIKLQVVAGECLAAISLAVGHIVGSAASASSSSRADSSFMRATKALEIMEQERMYDVAYHLVTSASSRSLDPSRNTPQARLREAAGLSLLALSSCSTVSSSYLVSNKAVSDLLNIAAESIGAPSAIRGEWASRGLCYLETAAQLLLKAWKDKDKSCLSLLLDALDAGAVPLASKLVKAKVHLKHHDRAYSQMRIKIATCFMVAAMFGIAATEGDEQNKDVGSSRLYSAIDADCAASLAYSNESEGRTDLVASTIFLLGATLPYAQRFANEDKDEPLPMMNLSEACLMAVSSMCGGTDGPASKKTKQDKYSHLRRDASVMACRALTSSSKDRPGALLPAVLIGALGTSLVSPALRATLAIAQNGHELSGELARCGALVPVGDILQQSLSSGERKTFSTAIAIVRYCGPCANAEGANSGTIVSLKNAIRTLSVLVVSDDGGAGGEQRRKALASLKLESLLALEALSSNEMLLGTMIEDAFPALTRFLESDTSALGASDEDDMVCSALETIRSIISLPSSGSSSAVKGTISSLVRILNSSCGDEVSSSRKVQVSLELLHSIAMGKRDLAGNGSLLSSGALDAVASLLEGTTSPKTTILGLDIVDFIASDVDSAIFSPNIDPSFRDSMARQFINGISSHDGFLKALIATMVDSNKGADDDTLSISNMYGAPLSLPDGVDSMVSEQKAVKLLFTIASILCGDTSGAGKEHFLRVFMLGDVRSSSETVAFACSVMLQILMDESNGLCVPERDPAARAYYLGIKLPAMRTVLLEGLSSSLDECMSSNSSRQYAEALVSVFEIPKLCLSFCRSKNVSQAAFDLYENVVLPLPIDVLGDLLLGDKDSLVALLDLVTGRGDSVEEDHEHMRKTFAQTLGSLAKAGHLPAAVERFGVRNNAIAALCAAMQGSEDGNIDDNEDSLPRICIECLASILDNKEKGELEMTSLEARTMAMAIGSILSSTVLSRFFTQASLETTFDDAIDHTSDRCAISRSAEARLLCSLASFPETLEILKRSGGLEAIGLIANEGELAAIRAVGKACELSPKSVVDVDAHLSIMDAFVHVNEKLSKDEVDVESLRKVANMCLEIITTLCRDAETKSSIQATEQSFRCLEAATCIISSSSKSRSPKTEAVKIGATLPGKVVSRRKPKSTASPAGESPSKKVDNASDDLQLGDLVFVDSTSGSGQSPSPKGGRTHDAEQLEGTVAHLGAVKFAPGDDWIGVRLTGPSQGLGRNDGSVKGVRYFDCSEKDGVFVRRNNVMKRPVGEDSDVDDNYDDDNEAQADSIAEKKIEPPAVDVRREQMWGRLLVPNDLTLERAAFSLLQSLSSSKPHRDLLMQNKTLANDMAGVIRLQSPALLAFQCDAMDLIVSFTLHAREADAGLAELFCLAAESQLKALQLTRDRREQMGSKHLLAMAISGLRNMFSSFIDDSFRERSLRIASELFVFLADSLYKGPKSRRLAATPKDGVLFYELSSFFMLSIGSTGLMTPVLSSRFVSSLFRFVMMTAGVTSLACHVPIAAEAEHWIAASSHCLYFLVCNITESSQERLGISYASLIKEVEASPNTFRSCLEHIAGTPGLSSVSAKKLIEAITV